MGKLPSGFDYGMESALQRGDRASEPVSAWRRIWSPVLPSPILSIRPDIGNELDIQAQWTVKRHSLLDFGVGHIFRGEFLRNAGRDSAYNCMVFGITQQF